MRVCSAKLCHQPDCTPCMQIEKRKWVNAGTNNSMFFLLFVFVMCSCFFSKFSHFAELHCAELICLWLPPLLYTCCRHLRFQRLDNRLATAPSCCHISYKALPSICNKMLSNDALQQICGQTVGRYCRIYAVSWYVDKYANACCKYLQTHTRNYFLHSCLLQYLLSKYTQNSTVVRGAHQITCPEIKFG